MSRGYWIDAQFRRRVRLTDGSVVRLRLLRPEDRERLAQGLLKLSERSRYRRFLAATTQLSPSALRYLVEVDQVNHVALVASTDARDPAAQEGLGVARFIRVPGEPEVAEPAVTVIDSAQGKGLGRILLAALTVAARERGITRFRAEVLAENSAVTSLLRELDDSFTKTFEGPVVRVEAKLPEVPLRGDWARPRAAPTNALLRLAAQGLDFRRPGLPPAGRAGPSEDSA